MKRAQKNFERDPTKKIFGQAKPYAMRKQKITNKVRDLMIHVEQLTITRIVAINSDNSNKYKYLPETSHSLI